MIPLMISYSDSTKQVQELIHSCQRWGMDVDAEEGNHCKPFFILNKLQKHKRSVLWVSPRASFLQFSDFKEFADCDFSLRVNEFLPEGHPARLVDNVLFVQYNTPAVTFIEKWCQSCEQQEESSLLQSLLSSQQDLRFMPMPLKYCKMHDSDDLFIAQQEVVIEFSSSIQPLKQLMHALRQHHCCR